MYLSAKRDELNSLFEQTKRVRSIFNDRPKKGKDAKSGPAHHFIKASEKIGRFVHNTLNKKSPFFCFFFLVARLFTAKIQRESTDVSLNYEISVPEIFFFLSCFLLDFFLATNESWTLHVFRIPFCNGVR